MQDTGFFNPQEIHQHLKIHEGMQIADFGSGSGEIAVLLAQAVGKNGRVTAIDLLTSALESLQEKSTGLENIISVRANLEVPGSSKLADDSQDAVFLANILWQSPQPVAILREAARILKSDGTIMVIEWKTKLPAEKLEPIIKDANLQVAETFHAGAFHHGLTAKKP